MADEQYGDKNRAFLQAVMARGTITVGQGIKIVAHIEAKDRGLDSHRDVEVTEGNLDEYITTANEAILDYDYEIRSIVLQTDDDKDDTRTRSISFINTTSDGMSQLATTHSAEEIAYVKRLLDAMFETFNTRRSEVMAVPVNDALHLSRPRSQRTEEVGITSKEAERLLKSLVAEGWLTCSVKRNYSLSPRALLELRHYLISTYNDDPEDEDAVERIKLCRACKDIVTIGLRCPNLSCNVRLHNMCVKSFFLSQRNGKKCPACQMEWTGRDYVGEKAIPSRSSGRPSQSVVERPSGQRSSTQAQSSTQSAISTQRSLASQRPVASSSSETSSEDLSDSELDSPA